MGVLGEAISRRSVGYQITALALAGILPLMLATYLMYSRMVANDRANIEQSLAVNAKTLAGLVDNEIEIHSAIAVTLAASPTLATGDLNSFWQEATDALQFVPDSWLILRAPSGEVLLSTLQPYSASLTSPALRVEFQPIAANKVYTVSDLMVDPLTKKQVAWVDVSVYQQGTLKYFISISLPPERFLALFKNNYTRDEVVAILDRKRLFVARQPAHELRLGTLASEGWRAAIDKAPSGVTSNYTLEGDFSVTGYAQTKNGWTVGAARLENSIQTPLRNILWSTLALAAVLAALSHVLAFMIARRVIGGMGALAKAAEDLGQGKKLLPFSSPFAEATTVVSSLVAASKELDRRGRALEGANSQLEEKVLERTAQLKAELRRREQAETTLIHSQKIATIGQLTGGIAHDFNNMLTVIMGNLDTVQRRLRSIQGAAVLSRPIESAQQGARNAAKLTHRLLAFARQQPLEPQVLSLNSLMTGISDMMARTVGEEVKIETVLGAGLWMTCADAGQIENAILNLAVNARDAMPGGGKLTIETGNSYLDETYTNSFGDVKPGQYVMLSVTDTGTGITKERLQRIFEPFFTTKEVGKGTGLGLAMIYGFVKQSEGHIQVYSEVGHGTTVKIYLPRSASLSKAGSAPVGKAIVASAENPSANKGEVVLLVEDDRDVREYAISVLEDLGYRVLAAADGATAVAVFKKTKRVDLLFTDVVLGGALNGRQVADAIKTLAPALPVLFTTGYTRNAIFHQGKLDSDVNLLNKPYTQRDLAHKVRSVLDQTQR